MHVLNDRGYSTAEDAMKAFKHTPDWMLLCRKANWLFPAGTRYTYQVTER